MKLNAWFNAAACVIATLSPTSVHAIVATDIDNLLRQQVLPGQYTGVVALEGYVLENDAFSSFCTGSLLPGGFHILTAAHCLTQFGTTTLNPSLVNQPFWVDFKLTSTPTQVPIHELYILPTWEGSVVQGNDLAILSLFHAAPAEAEQYDVYRDTDELGRTFTKVGYGTIGVGDTGEEFSNGLVAFSGQNQFDGADTDLVNLLESSVKVAPGSQLLFDFDNGLSANNLIGGLGLGNDEVNTASGDSGSPAFIGSRIAGITSYGLGGFVTDVDSDVNASFGELSGETRVSTYTSFIDAVIGGRIAPTARNTAVPEPTTLVGSALGGLWLLKRGKQRTPGPEKTRMKL